MGDLCRRLRVCKEDSSPAAWCDETVPGAFAVRRGTAWNSAKEHQKYIAHYIVTYCHHCSGFYFEVDSSVFFLSSILPRANFARGDHAQRWQARPDHPGLPIAEVMGYTADVAGGLSFLTLRLQSGARGVTVMVHIHKPPPRLTIRGG